jgi:hypothetical protein
MADYQNSNLIINIAPYRFQTGVATNAPINVQFSRDMQSASFNDSTIALQISGTVARIPVAYSYYNRILTITPTVNLQPNTTYTVTIVGDTNPSVATVNAITGIQDVTGNGMLGQFSWSFTTSAVTVPIAPNLTSPADENAINQQPVFSWTPVSGADHYEIQVSNSNTFETIFWPLVTDSYSQTMTTVTPARPFTYNLEYWWRVRAIALDSNNNEIPGDWSIVASFYYGDPTYGTVTPDDAPLGVLPPTQAIPTVVSAWPSPAMSNLQTYPEQITAVVSGQINLSNLQPNAFTICGKAVDGNWNSNAFAPTFTPSLNGSQYGGGGMIISGPADGYEMIVESGVAQGVSPDGSFDGVNTTISLTLPQSYWQDNNWYKVTLDFPELQAPVEWDFTSAWKPVFTSAHSVRELTDFFMPELTDNDVWFVVRRNSLYAIWIQVYMPTKVDANFQIYQPPISFDVNNPPFYAREYVRIKSGLDLLKAKYYNLLAKPMTTLADFTVNPNTGALKENISQAINEMKLELKEFEDALRGHSNRGYARGRATERGSWGPDYGRGKIDTFNFPWHVHNHRRGF